MSACFRHTAQPHPNLMKYKRGGASNNHLRPTPPPPFLCRQNWSCHLDPPNTDHMWVQPWQSDCIVEQAAEFIRKKLARRSAGLAPIGQSRGPLRLRAPQTFLRIIFSIPLLSSVRTDQITAQGLHCEGLFKKPCFHCRSLLCFPSLSPHTPQFQKRKKKKKKTFSHHDFFFS